MNTIGRPRPFDRSSRPGWVGRIVIVVGVVVIATTLLDMVRFGQGDLDIWLLTGAGIVILVTFGLAFERAVHQRIRRVLTPWAEERGLVFVGSVDNPRTTPLLRKKGKLTAAMTGPVGGDPEGLLAHYSYTVQHGKTSTTYWFSVALARFDGREGLRVRVFPTSARLAEWFDGWSLFDTKSLEIDERFKVEAAAGHDPLQVTELLDPVTLLQLLEEPVPPIVEIDDGTLMVAMRGRVGVDAGVADLELFDHLRTHADAWRARIDRI